MPASGKHLGPQENILGLHYAMLFGHVLLYCTLVLISIIFPAKHSNAHPMHLMAAEEIPGASKVQITEKCLGRMSTSRGHWWRS